MVMMITPTTGKASPFFKSFFFLNFQLGKWNKQGQSQSVDIVSNNSQLHCKLIKDGAGDSLDSGLHGPLGSETGSVENNIGEKSSFFH